MALHTPVAKNLIGMTKLVGGEGGGGGDACLMGDKRHGLPPNNMLYLAGHFKLFEDSECLKVTLQTYETHSRQCGD